MHAHLRSSRRGPRGLGPSIVLALATTLGAATLAEPALAQPSASDRALAETLYQDARKLMADKKFDEACPKLAESQRLDPGTGTLLNLATCHESSGKLASAWTEFSDAIASARRDERPDREKYAQERVKAIEPKLSRIAVSVSPAADIAGLEVRLDGAILGRVAYGLASPVDPGKHSVVASAPGKRRWVGEVTVGAVADKQTITVPALEDEAAAAVPAPATPAAPAIVPAAAAAAPTATPPPAAATSPGGAPARDAASPPRGSGSRTAAYVLGGVGIVGVGVGGFFGLQAMSRWSDRNAGCPDGRCDQSAVDAASSAGTDAWISNIGIGVGLVALGAGTYLFLSSSSDGAPQRKALHVVPAVGTSSGGLVVGGGF